MVNIDRARLRLQEFSGRLARRAVEGLIEGVPCLIPGRDVRVYSVVVALINFPRVAAHGEYLIDRVFARLPLVPEFLLYDSPKTSHCC